MAANMIIDQAGLPAGTAGKTRTDGLATGALVTLTSAGGGTTHRFQLLWAPTAAWASAPASLTQTTPTTWTFTPAAGVYGTYRIELIVDEGLSTEDRQIRLFGVRTPVKGLRLPALNEIASSLATLLNNGADQIAASEANENIVGGPFAAGNYGGWYPELELAFDEIEAGGGGGSGKQTAKIIVGNSVAGDTLAICDYLDIGDGAQLSAALAAAGAGADVYIRPGTYDLGAGATVAPLAIPAFATVRGAGMFATTIVTKTSANMGAFTMVAGSDLRDLNISVPATTAAGSGATAVVSIAGPLNSLSRVLVAWGVYGAPEVANLAIRNSFFVAPDIAEPNTLQECYVTGAPSLRDLGVLDDLSGFRSGARTSPGGVVPHVLRDCKFSAGDVGVWAESPVAASQVVCNDAYVAGFRISGAQNFQSALVECIGSCAAVVPTSAVFNVQGGAGRVRISACNAHSDNAGTAVGILLESADECVISGCTVEDMLTGISLNATSDNNIVLANQLPGCTTAITDLGAGNDVAHNI